MNFKKKLLAASSMAVAATLTFASTPAFAAPFDDEDLVINGLSIEYNPDASDYGHVYAWDADGSVRLGDSTTHAAGQLSFFDEANSPTYAFCAVETANKVEETDGDVVITCGAQALTGDLDGLTVTPEYRFYKLATPNIVMTRMLYSVANTTSASITVPRIEANYAWDELDPTWNMLTNNGTVREDTPLTGTSTRWFNTASYVDNAVNPDDTTFGGAWRANGNSYFTEYGYDTVSNDDDLTPISEDVVIPANSTVMFAFFAVYGSAGVDATPEETTAFMTVLEAQFAVFNQAFTTSSILAKGIPEGSNVLNWGTVAAAPSSSPELANTGGETDWAYGALLLSGLLVSAGVVLARGRRE